MKHKKISLKWKIFIYLLCFAGILIGLLWVLQTVYLDEFYKHIKMRELSNAVENAENAINSSNTEDMLESIAKNYDVCIVVSDSKGKVLYSTETNINCSIHFMSSLQLKMYYAKTREQSGDILVYSDDIPEFILDKKDFNELNPSNEQQDGTDERINKKPQYEFDGFQGMPRRNAALDGVIRMKLVTAEDGSEVMLMVNSIITPVDATVYTIRIQLIYISVVLVVLALLMAVLISMKVSKSIAKVNNSAKRLAKGDFDVEFDGKDYREIAELSDTLNYATTELARVENLQKELIANVSHDLRTPLTMITAYSEVMRDIPGENTPENIQVVIDEAKRLTFLVNDLLEISKLQAGAEVLNIKEYDLTEAIKTVIDRYAKLVEQDGYKIEFRYYDNVCVRADEYKIYQVVYNLINNAINYTGEDKTVIVNQIVNGNVVRIEVCDTGEGIPKEEINNVWERYYKIDKEHKRAIMGTGLGLSIVNGILKKHNARHGVESEPGKGSKFWFELETVTK